MPGASPRRQEATRKERTALSAVRFYAFCIKLHESGWRPGRLRDKHHAGRSARTVAGEIGFALPPE